MGAVFLVLGLIVAYLGETSFLAPASGGTCSVVDGRQVGNCGVSLGINVLFVGLLGIVVGFAITVAGAIRHVMQRPETE